MLTTTCKLTFKQVSIYSNPIKGVISYMYNVIVSLPHGPG